MLSIQKFASDWTSLRYGFSSSNIAFTSTIVFVPPSNNVEIENNDVKTDLASESIDKGKSILGAPPKHDKKETKNPRAKKANSLRRLTLKSLNKRSSISVIIVELPVILDQIAISD